MNFPVNEPIIMSIGGSLVVPDGGPNVDFLQRLERFVTGEVERGRKFILIIGGGKTARHYIQAAEQVREIDAEDLDWLGIHATRLNAHLLRTIFRGRAYQRVIKNPYTVPKNWQEPVLVAAGWKPGASTDYVAARIARKVKARNIINMSNIDCVYDKDPRKFADAQPFSEMSWRDYRAMVGDEWSPGLSAPFDPVASRFCHKNGIDAFIVSGDFDNCSRLISGEKYTGTHLRG